MNTLDKSHYDVLGVSADTPNVVIKAAFRALAKEYHPDGGGDAGADVDRFIELQNAYTVLSDPELRRAYDEELRDVRAAGNGQGALPAMQPPPQSSDVFLFPPGSYVHTAYARLSLYSDVLAASFHDAAVSGKGEDELLAYAAQLEEGFFARYFGADPDIRAMARLLLLRSQKSALMALNEAVTASAAAQPSGKPDLAHFVDVHLSGEGLFSEWLKARFPGEPARKVAAHAPPEKPGTAPPAPRKPAPAQTRRRFPVFRRAVRLFCWSFALYFGIFAASTLVD